MGWGGKVACDEIAIEPRVERVRRAGAGGGCHALRGEGCHALRGGG